MRHLPFVGLLCSFALLAASCGDDEPAVRQCTFNSTLVQADFACVTDEHCPCGTYCTLGACNSDCTTDPDCGDGRCDDFGRCRAAGEDTTIPAPPSQSSPGLVLSSRNLRFGATGVAHRFELTALDRPLTRIRVTAPEGFSVACEGSDYQPECSYSGVEALGSKTLRVRLDAGPDLTQAGALRLFHGADRYTIGLSPEAPVPDGPRPGVYAGFARLHRMGLSTEGSEVRVLSEGTVHALRAELFLDAAGAGVVVLHDPRRAIHPDGQLIGSIQIAAGQGQGSLTWPSFSSFHSVVGAQAQGTALAGLDTQVIVRPVSGQVSMLGSGPTLSFSLSLTYEGVGEGSSAPRVVYNVALTRQGPLLEGAVQPAPMQDAPAPAPDRRGLISDWETAVFSALSPGPGLTPTESDAFFARTDEGYLDACGPARSTSLIDAELAARYAFFYEGEVLDANDPSLRESLNPFVRGLSAGLVQAGLTPANDKYVIDLKTAWDGWQGPAPAHSIPCQIAADPINLYSCNIDLEVPSVDVCAEVAQQYGCRPEATPGARARISLGIYLSSGDAATVCGGNVFGNPPPANLRSISVQRSCVFETPLGGLGCAQMGLCYVPPTATQTIPDPEERASTAAALLGDALDASGDLECADQGRSAGLFDSRRTGGLFEVYSACLRELDEARSATVPTPAALHGAGLRQLFKSDAGCLDAARFAFTLGQAAASRQEGALTLAHRLIQQWLTLHALVAREATQLDPIRPVLQLAPADDPDPARALDVSLAGWQLLFHPKYFGAVEALSDRLTYDPDYRPLMSTAALDPSESQVGLPVTMIETLHAQAQLLEVLVRRGHRRNEPEILDVLGEFLRTEAPVRAMAGGLTERALTYARDNDLPAATWQSRYVSATRAYERTLSKLTQTAHSFEVGQNPLGIEDSDLPLYFLGNEMNAASRFTAISDFLLGAPGAANPFGKASVNDAQAALEGARSAGLMLQDREFERRLAPNQAADRLDELRRSYGNELVSYCGLPPGLSSPSQVLERWPNQFSANNCYLLSADPRCVVPVQAYEAAMRVDDVEYQFCVVRELRARTGQGIGFLDPTYDGIAAELESCDQLSFPVQCPAGVSGPCASCAEFSPSLLTSIGRGLADLIRCEDSPNAPECQALLTCDSPAPHPSCGTVSVGPSTFSAVQGLAETPVELLEEAKRVCRGLYPDAQASLPSPDQLPGQPQTDSACYNGSLGEMALTLRGISIDVDVARSELSDLQDAYDVAIRSCLIQQAGNDTLESLTGAHNRTMGVLREQKATADKVAAGAAATKDCAGSVGVEDFLSFGATAAAECVAAGVEAAMTIDSIEIGKKMEEAQDAHDALMLSVGNQITEQLCFNDAELHLVGVRTAALRIQRAAQDLSVALYQFDQSKSSAQTAYEAGRAALEILSARALTPAAHDYWFDESVDTYVAKMQIARRIMYLAVRAVEYEFQTSFVARQEVLSAEIPGDLDSVISDLLRDTATRGIGSKPSDLKIVLSLRKNLLQLGDLSKTQPEGWHQLSDVQRFQMLLRSPRFAEYDDSGRYAGQRIPFDLGPLAALELGQTQGISVFSTNACAERLWSVNASIQGQDVYRGDAKTFTDIDLLKSNTFYSQWCGDSPADTPFQVASVRPSRNLFREPELGVSFGQASKTSQGMSRARIQAHFNLDRTEFERDAFSSGSTEELAARGLYGQYALFIPAAVLSVAEGQDGLVLSNVDDILLRLDYVSVAR